MAENLEADVRDTAGLVIAPFQTHVILKEIAKHLDYQGLTSLNLTCKGIRSRLMWDFRKLSKLEFSFDGGLEEPRKVRQFNRHLRKCLTSRAIPVNIRLDFSSFNSHDAGEVLWRLFQKFGEDVKTFRLRLRDVYDVEQILEWWKLMPSLTELELEYEDYWSGEQTQPSSFLSDYDKGLYLSSLQKLTLPFDSLDQRPVKAFLFQVDMTNLVHLSSPEGHMLSADNLKILRRYTGYRFEPDENVGMVRYIKIGNPEEVLLETSSGVE